MGIGDQHVLGLRAVDQVAEAPAGSGLEAVAAAQALGNEVTAVLRRRAVLRGVRIEVGADGTSDDPLAFGVALHGAAELFDHAHRLVAMVDDPWVTGYSPLRMCTSVPANSGGGDVDQRIIGAHIWDWAVHDLDAIF